MLKITESLKVLALKIFRADGIEVIKISGKANKTAKNLSKSKKSKNKKFKNLTYIKTIGELTFLTLNAKKVFNYLRQVFIKALIFQYFNLKCYIYIEIDVSSYTISGVFNQLSTN